jgi:hypothetical protein
MPLQPGAADTHLRPRSSSAGRLRGLSCGLLLLALPLLLPLAKPLSLAGQSQTSDPVAPDAGLGFSIEVLSRGGGVPEAALNTLRRIREDLEAQQARGVTVVVSETRLGLEGERRLCAAFEEPEAADAALRRAHSIAAGVDLVNLKAGACSD